MSKTFKIPWYWRKVFSFDVDDYFDNPDTCKRAIVNGCYVEGETLFAMYSFLKWEYIVLQAWSNIFIYDKKAGIDYININSLVSKGVFVIELPDCIQLECRLLSIHKEQVGNNTLETLVMKPSREGGLNP